MEGSSKEELDKDFKKPMLVGKIGKFPKRIIQNKSSTLPESQPVPVIQVEASKEEPVNDRVVEKVKDIGYTEPSWGGLPIGQHDYVLEVLKNGSIIETINLMKKSYWVFGRLTNTDVYMQHPTISRHHAVLQFRSHGTAAEKAGFYIYDLESTHGTFLNKNRIRPRSYTKVHVGHMLKLGCSTRTFILNGPTDDAEEESELSITELKQKRLEELQQREEQKNKQEELKRKQEERGVDWGLGEDADEDTDLSENPYAQTNNEELYLDNPKKALRGFFEREGLELDYDCSEQGMGQFLCKVELPLDDEMGRSIFAEVIHKGKKKEAVVQCALEACRILDRYGVLRQATHESRKRKPKNWEENDYYDSDDDTFLDRTGTIEKKREMRMNTKVPQKAETYESLLKQEKTLAASVKELELELSKAQKKLASDKEVRSEEADSLDSFMLELKQSKPTKQAINKLKLDIAKVKQEHSNVIRLVNVAKPATLPPLVANYDTLSTVSEKKNVQLPIFGKRIKLKVEKPKIDLKVQTATHEDVEEEVEDDNTQKEDLIMMTETEDPPPLKSEETAKTSENFNERKDMDEKRKKRNQRRIHQKQEKAEIEKQRGYQEDAAKEDYNMWTPPQNQSGDGRTTLNDKYGY